MIQDFLFNFNKEYGIIFLIGRNKKVNYIHYGSNKFDINIFKKIKNRPKFVKPEGGLWASRVETEHGWKDWCITNNRLRR